MKTRFKTKSSKKIEFIPKYKVEKKYFPLFKNINLRNNQNYVLWGTIIKKINYYWNKSFIWWSMIRIMTENSLKKYVTKDFKQYLPMILITSIFLFLSIIAWINLVTIILCIITISFLWNFIFSHYKKNKNIITLKDKNKYIIFKNEK